MEALTARTPLHAEQGTETARTTDASRTLAVTATYLLSEEGRKASLLAGGDGRAVQELTLHVPANRLHLVAVDPNGVARLKLRPRYHLDRQDDVVRVDAPPTYDVPPDLETLFREAARNHQLEQTYHGERRAAKAQRRESDTARRTQLAQAFLHDPTQRALVHPAPTPTRCYLATDRGRVMFDAHTDKTPAKDVPREAHRRFRADLCIRQDENQRVRAEQLAVHDEKTRVIAAWIAAHGTPDQQARQAAGVLPMDEALRAMSEQAFASVANRAEYRRDGAARLQRHLRQFPRYADVVIARWDLQVTSAHTATASASQWALVQEFRQTFPTATVTLRTHRLAWKHDRSAPAITVYGVLVTQKCGSLTLRREFDAPGEELAP
jgi:hypothetical protein